MHMSITAFTIACLVWCAGTSHATPLPHPTRKLVATLDVQSADAPRYLCIVSDLAGCDRAQARDSPESCPYPLTSVLPTHSIHKVDAAGHPQLVTFDEPLHAATPPDVAAAWRQLVPVADPSCTANHEACHPELELPSRMFASSAIPPRILCSNSNTSGHDGNVAFLYIYFSHSSIDSGISQIELQGTNATVTFYSDINAHDYVYAEVIGGAYVPSPRTLIGTQERLLIPLHPRCELYVAELPPHVGLTQPIATIRSTDGRPQATCTASGADSSSFQIRIPYTDQPHLTKLQLTSGAAIFETSWSEPLPPKPFRLSVRALKLTWRRDCMAGSWPGSDPPAPPSTRVEWNAQCPRVTLAAAGVICELQPAPTAEPEVCSYRCAVPDTITPVQLPTPIQLDRLRVHDGATGPRADTVYAWTDTLRYAGEELRSFVPPPERRVVIDLEPGAWVEHKGDTIDEIRILWPTGATGLIDAPNREWSRWRAMPAPGITCTDEVRIEAFGSRAYEWRPFAVAGGRIALPPPSAFLCPTGRCFAALHLWIWGGMGVSVAQDSSLSSPSRPHFYGALGTTLEAYEDVLLTPSTLELDVSADLSQRTFSVVQPPATTASIHDDWYPQLNLLGRYVLWHNAVLRYALATGITVGFPLFSDDDGRLPTTLAYTFELSARFRMFHHSGKWFEVAAGLERRLLEGAPRAGERAGSAAFQLYVTARYRFRIG
jgi:hypothetical protein